MSSLIPPFSTLVASMSADLTKRLADERVWDALMRGPIGQSLRRVSDGHELSTEMAMYLASAITKWHIGQDTPLASYLNEVLGDIAPEIAKRMRQNVAEPTGVSARNPSEPIGFRAILAIPAGQRDELLHWFSQQNLKTQKRVRSIWIGWNPLEMLVFAGMSPQSRQAFVDLAKPNTPNATANVAGAIDEVARMIAPWRKPTP